MTEELQIKYSRIYKKYVGDLYSYGKAFGIEEDMIIDIIHDVFLHIFEHNHLLQEDEHLKFYLLKSLKNRIISLNRNQIHTESIDDIDEGYEFTVSVNAIDEIEEQEIRETLIRKTEMMMECLTNRQREAIYLHFKQELDYDEIAVLLNMTTKGVRKLVYRAIERLRRQFGESALILLLFI
jgi:RNA polymerase sigma factor (sigma-70 family)